MTQHFDLAVIGSGPSASRIAKRCADKLSVALIEERDVGGACALRGCNPKKVLVHSAELLDFMRRADGKLVSNSGKPFTWGQLINFKKSFTDPIPKNSKQSFEDAGVTVFHGAGKFVDESTVLAGDTQLSADHFAICTGARPVPLEIPGKNFIRTSDEFMEQVELPEHIVFIGGGYISFEFAHVARRFGKRVTIVERGSRPLGNFEAFVVDKLVAHSRNLGIQVLTESEVVAVSRVDESNYKVTVLSNGQHDELEAGLVVHGAGRVPNVDELNLKAANVDFSKHGVVVNDQMQSPTNPKVYAAGDVVDSNQSMLTPVANQQGYVVAKNILEGSDKQPKYGAVPKVVFTVPAVASIGYTETKASEAGLDFEVLQEDRTDDNSIRKVCGEVAAHKLLVEKKTGRLLGAHLIGPASEELINVFAVAMHAKVSASDLKSILFAFPTFSSDIRSMV